MSRYRDLSAAGKELVDVHAGHSSLSENDDDNEGKESAYSETNVSTKAEKGKHDYLFDSSDSETETVVTNVAHAGTYLDRYCWPMRYDSFFHWPSVFFSAPRAGGVGF